MESKEKLSTRYAKELKSLEKLSDEELEAQVQAFMPNSERME
jgi:hypothetical protein